MNRTIVVTAALAAATVALTACSAPATDEGSSDGEGTPIKVGIIAPLTGPAAPFGVPVVAVIEERVDQLNAEGGIDGNPIELSIKDDTTDPTVAAQKATELVAEGVVAVIGPVTSSTALAAVPITSAAKVPDLVFAAAPVVTDPAQAYFDYTWRSAPNDDDAIPLTMEKLVEQGVKKIAIMSQDDANGALGTEVLKKLAKENDIEVVATATAALTATDALPQATVLRDGDPEAVVMQLTSVGLAATFLRAADDVGLDVPLLGGTGLGQPALIEAAGAAADGLTVLNFLDPSNLTDAQSEFYDAMIENGGEPVYTFAEIMAVAAVDIFAAAVENAEEVTAQGINDALDAGVSADSISLAPVEFSEDDHDFFTKESLVWTTVVDGEFTAE